MKLIELFVLLIILFIFLSGCILPSSLEEDLIPPTCEGEGCGDEAAPNEAEVSDGCRGFESCDDYCAEGYAECFEWCEENLVGSCGPSN